MPPDKKKPPTKTKVQLMAEIHEIIEDTFSPAAAIEYLLNHFTAWDLEEILKDVIRIRRRRD